MPNRSDNGEARRLLRPLTMADAAPLSRCPQIVVVDDEPDTAVTFAKLLETMGCDATPVTDPFAAIETVERVKAELVFLDINMPGLNGVELARALRGKHGWEGIRLVAVTGWGSPEHRAATREAGFDAHVVKPVDHNLVESMLHMFFPETRWT